MCKRSCACTHVYTHQQQQQQKQRQHPACWPACLAACRQQQQWTAAEAAAAVNKTCLPACQKHVYIPIYIYYIHINVRNTSTSNRCYLSACRPGWLHADNSRQCCNSKRTATTTRNCTLSLSGRGPTRTQPAKRARKNAAHKEREKKSSPQRARKTKERKNGSALYAERS